MTPEIESLNIGDSTSMTTNQNQKMLTQILSLEVGASLECETENLNSLRAQVWAAAKKQGKRFKSKVDKATKVLTITRVS